MNKKRKITREDKLKIFNQMIGALIANRLVFEYRDDEIIKSMEKDFKDE